MSRRNTRYAYFDDSHDDLYDGGMGLRKVSSSEARILASFLDENDYLIHKHKTFDGNCVAIKASALEAPRILKELKRWGSITAMTDKRGRDIIVYFPEVKWGPGWSNHNEEMMERNEAGEDEWGRYASVSDDLHELDDDTDLEAHRSWGRYKQPSSYPGAEGDKYDRYHAYGEANSGENGSPERKKYNEWYRKEVMGLKKARYRRARFEEGVPADPTVNMSEEDAQEWRANTEKYKDKFKKASSDERAIVEEPPGNFRMFQDPREARRVYFAGIKYYAKKKGLKYHDEDIFDDAYVEGRNAQRIFDKIQAKVWDEMDDYSNVSWESGYRFAKSKKASSTEKAYVEEPFSFRSYAQPELAREKYYDGIEYYAKKKGLKYHDDWDSPYVEGRNAQRILDKIHAQVWDEMDDLSDLPWESGYRFAKSKKASHYNQRIAQLVRGSR